MCQAIDILRRRTRRKCPMLKNAINCTYQTKEGSSSLQKFHPPFIRSPHSFPISSPTLQTVVLHPHWPVCTSEIASGVIASNYTLCEAFHNVTQLCSRDHNTSRLPRKHMAEAHAENRSQSYNVAFPQTFHIILLRNTLSIQTL